MAPPVNAVQRVLPVAESKARTAPSDPATRVRPAAVTGAVGSIVSRGDVCQASFSFAGTRTGVAAVRRLLAR